MCASRLLHIQHTSSLCTFNLCTRLCSARGMTVWLWFGSHTTCVLHCHAGCDHCTARSLSQAPMAKIHSHSGLGHTTAVHKLKEYFSMLFRLDYSQTEWHWWSQAGFWPCHLHLSKGCGVNPVRCSCTQVGRHGGIVVHLTVKFNYYHPRTVHMFNMCLQCACSICVYSVHVCSIVYT